MKADGPASILIPNYRGGDALHLCLESIRHYTPEGTCQIIVANDYDPDGEDNAYLDRAAGTWGVSVHYAKRRLSHGAVLNWLVNDLCRTRRAVILDNDIEILAPGWLEESLRLLNGDRVLAACDVRPQVVVSEQGYCLPFYRAWFCPLNMDIYRDMGAIDWEFAYADANAPPIAELVRPLREIKKGPGFLESRACLDPGSKLWAKVHFDNPRGYRVLPIPSGISEKFRHIGHYSYLLDIPDGYSEEIRQDKIRKHAEVRRALEQLRARGGN